MEDLRVSLVNDIPLDLLEVPVEVLGLKQPGRNWYSCPSSLLPH